MPPVAQPSVPSVAHAPLLEELQAVGPATSPEQARRLASRLAQALHDPQSLGCYISVLARVVAGTLSLPCLIAAYKAGVGAVNKARKPGSIFMWTLTNWVPPPLPSQVRYYQQATHPPAPAGSPAPSATATPTPVEPALTQEAEVATLRDIAASRSPFARVAAKRLLAEFGIDLSQIGTGGGID
jgi:pyruvate/2-oxoglutarate dehydrogenase complex dihydrolipoamide acyltransferase (E2) component